MRIFEIFEIVACICRLPQNICRIFPTLNTEADAHGIGFGVEEELTLKFTQHTKDSISQELSLIGKSTNVDTLLGSLQPTLDFEKYVNNHFHYINQQQMPHWTGG
jgi:hypothetical protein